MLMVKPGGPYLDIIRDAKEMVKKLFFFALKGVLFLINFCCKSSRTTRLRCTKCQGSMLCSITLLRAVPLT